MGQLWQSDKYSKTALPTIIGMQDRANGASVGADINLYMMPPIFDHRSEMRIRGYACNGHIL